MRKLVVVPDARLRRESEPVKKIDKKIKELAGEMVKFLGKTDASGITSVGLSAVQLGEPVRMFAFKGNPGSAIPGDIIVVINPEIVYGKGRHLVREACLSLPGREFIVQRAKTVKVRGQTLVGDLRTFRGRDLLAQVFAHEVDHLNGVLIDTLGEKVK